MQDNRTEEKSNTFAVVDKFPIGFQQHIPPLQTPMTPHKKNPPPFRIKQLPKTWSYHPQGGTERFIQRDQLV